MALQTHLHRRHGTYHHRVRVPLDLVPRIRRRELTGSLGTKCPSEAKGRALLASHRARLIFQLIRTRNMLSEEQIATLVREFYQEQLRLDKYRRVADKPDLDWRNDEGMRFYLEHLGDTDAEIERAIRSSGKDVSDLIDDDIAVCDVQVYQEALQTRDWTFASSDADKLLKARGIRLERTSPAYRILCLELIRAQIEVMRVAAARSEGEWGAESQDPLFRQVERTSAALSPPVEPAKPLSTLFDEFISERARANMKPKTLGEFRTSFKWFNDYFGGERGVSEFTSHDLREYKNALMKVPADFAKHLKCDTIKDAIRLNAEREKQLSLLDAATINGKRLSNIDAFFKWAQANKYTGDNPAAGIRVFVSKASRQQKKREAFTIEHLNAIFRAPLYTGCKSSYHWKKSGTERMRDHRFWMALLALFTGARKSEVAQLNVSDVREIKGIWCLDVTDLDDEDKSLKNVYSKRRVPVHPELHKLGFIDYVKDRAKVGEKKLLDCEPGAKGDYAPFSQWYPRFLDSVGITGDQYVFHSFRHNFERAMVDTGMHDSVRYALAGRTSGHSSEGYMSEFKPAQLLEAITKVKYDGLDLTHLYVSEVGGQIREDI